MTSIHQSINSDYCEKQLFSERDVRISAFILWVCFKTVLSYKIATKTYFSASVAERFFYAEGVRHPQVRVVAPNYCIKCTHRTANLKPPARFQAGTFLAEGSGV